MGKDPIPVTMTDVIQIADEHFKKTLGVPFSEEGGFLDINLSWTGSLAKPVWYYLVTLRPYNKSKLKDPERWDYKIAILLNKKAYVAVTITKELEDRSDTIRESNIPFLQSRQRSELHPLEKNLRRLEALPDLKSKEHAGVYVHRNGSSAYIFYPDGCVFSIHTMDTQLYKVDDQKRVFTHYVYGPKKDKISSQNYIGVFLDGKFIADQGDYQDTYVLKEQISSSPSKSGQPDKAKPDK